MRIYVTARYQGTKNRSQIETLCKYVRAAGFEDFCFIRDVEHYEKMFDRPSQLMHRARLEIERSDVLLVDLTDRPTGGRIAEAGMAYAMRKPVIMLAKSDTAVSDAVLGMASTFIKYQRESDITAALEIVAKSLT